MLDVIKIAATRLSESHLERGFKNHEKFLDLVRERLWKIDDSSDKIKFINIVLEHNHAAYEHHLPRCTNRQECEENLAHEMVKYYLTQDLKRLGVTINDDAFTDEEKKTTESRLEQILANLNELKNGQEILFNELNELRDLYFLGKKKWWQLLLGKSAEMVAAGIVSETVSEKILNEIDLKGIGLIG